MTTTRGIRTVGSAAAMVMIIGCGNPVLTCQTTHCSAPSTLSYQLCSGLTAVTYTLGATTCTVNNGNTTQAQACAQQVDAYCAGVAINPTDGGMSDASVDAGSVPCTYVVTGAQSSSGTCSVMSTYSASHGGLAFAVLGGSAFQFGATLSALTSPAPGTYTLADAAPGAGSAYNIITAAWVMCTTSMNCNDAMSHTIPPQGSFTLTITDPGPATSAGLLWQATQGTLTVTLPAQPAGSASGTCTVTVTL